MFWAAEETRTYHYIQYYDGPDVDTANVVFREYYDLKTDPFELDNLLGDSDPDNDPDVKAVAAQLARDRKCSAADWPLAELYRSASLCNLARHRCAAAVLARASRTNRD